jgi:hypothetical protein
MRTQTPSWLRPALALAALCALCSPALAQEPTPRPVAGGLGYFSPGVMAGRVGGTGGLSGPKALGAGGELPGFSYQLGGGGRALIGDVLIGGKGFGYDFGQASTARGQVRMSGGGGGLDVGYAISRQAGHLVYAYLGIGGMRFDMELTNHSDRPIDLDGVQVLPGEQTTLRAGSTYGEAGLGAHWMLLGPQGGPSVGVELGSQFKLNGGRWEGEGAQKALALQRAGWNGFFLRLAVGGGGFSLQ